MNDLEKLTAYRAYGLEIAHYLAATKQRTPPAPGSPQGTLLLENARAHHQELQPSVAKLIAQLPPGQSRVVTGLYYDQCLSPQEIADSQGISVRRVYAQLRAMKALAAAPSPVG